MNMTTAPEKTGPTSTGPAKRGSLVLLALLLSVGACDRDPASRLELAQQKVADSDYVTAIIELKNLLQSSPENIEARLLLARVSLALGDPLAAEKELNVALDLGTEASAQTALHYEIQLTLGGHAGILEALDLDGGTDGLSETQAMEIRGLALLGLGSSIEAETFFRQALAIDADSARARWGLAGALDREGETDAAQAELQTLITAHPGYSRGWALNGHMALRAGRLQGAVDSFRLAVQAAQKEPDRIVEMISLAGLADAQLGMQDIAGAEPTIGRLRSFAGAMPITRLLVARLAYAKQDYIGAASELERALNSNPGDIRADKISGERFWKTVVAGLIANYVMTMTGFWQSGLGLAAIDVGAMITGSMTAAHPDAPYTLVAGNLAHFANGVILALIWVAFLQKRVPGNWIVQGLVYALITQLAAWVIVAPLAFGAGFFFTNTPA
ncbi:MAG: tetratricopeptide repeat protein, partial [Proteobacteria bacterium]|nr:tetratricopeptide repeat protein [Pseudomonadota bacterium]